MEPTTLLPGQRVRSSMEPDLGLGIVMAQEERNLRVFFPGPEEERLYDSADAPLRRIRLQPGSEFPGPSGTLQIEEAKESEGLISYRCGKAWIPESDLPPFLEAQGPRDQILDGNWDSVQGMELRLEAQLAEHHLRSNPTQGLQGGRIRLYPHQIDLCKELCDRPRVRAMLADEVGLGKTIEALLIAHRLLLSERTKRILIVVPESLIHQWFAEAWLKFNLPFRLLDEGFLENLEDEEQGLLSQSRVICTLEQLELSDFAKENWDLLIVDEVHRVDSFDHEGEQIKRLCDITPHVLLLSATPSDLDSEEHFKKLSWLEPSVYHDYDKYCEHQKNNLIIGKLFEGLDSHDTPDATQLLKHLPSSLYTEHHATEELLQAVLDLHGPAHHLVKHTRKTVEGFPKRKPNLIPLQGDVKRMYKEWLHEEGKEVSFRYQGMENDPRIQALKTFLDENPQQKILVLGSSRLKVEATVKGLEKLGVKDIARFHEGQSLLERDRQAAWFSEDDGPPILVSSNLGAEGRNFQVASHLFLLDISTSPAMLEQRIGRLDRIGQEKDITIHLPFIEGAPQSWLIRWHHEAFNAFERPWCGVDEVHHQRGDELVEMILNKKTEGFNAFLAQTKEDLSRLLRDLELNRDHLLEKCWHAPDRAHELEASIVQEDQDSTLETFMQQAWELSGIDAIPIGRRTYRLKANDAYGQPFPGFKEKGMSVTFHRTRALKREDLTFLSWDHPMVRDTITLLSTGDDGRASVVEIPAPKPNILLDLSYRVHHPCPSHLQADRFLPPTPIRVSMDREGRTIRLKPEAMKKRWRNLTKLTLPQEELRLWLDSQLKKAEAIAKEKANILSKEAEATRKKEADRYEGRLEGLLSLNSSLNSDELTSYRKSHLEIQKGLSSPVVELDTIRIIICRPN